MIRRGPRPADRFAMIANEALENANLTWRARGVLAYLLSRPEGWSTSAERLASQSPKGKEGRDSMRAVLTELEAAGYLRREKTQDTRGRWSTSMVVYDSPVDTRGILFIPDALQPAKDSGSADELVAEAVEIMSKPLIVEPAKNGGSPGVGKPAVGQPAVGKPGPSNKTETKKENKKDSSSSSLRSEDSSEETPLKQRMEETRQRGETVASLLPEIREVLGWAPSLQDLTRAQKAWPWAFGGWKSVEIARDYVTHCRKKKWTPTTEGWWSAMEFENQRRERAPRKMYGPDGVPQ